MIDVKQLQQKKKRQLISLSGTLVCVLLLFSACDSTNLATEQNTAGLQNAPAAALIDALELSNDQASKVAQITEQYSADQPGRMWYIASELQQTLTEEQKNELIERAQSQRDAMRAQLKNRGETGREIRGVPNKGRFAERMFEELENPLSDEQKEQLSALHEEQVEAFKALISQRREGSLDAEQMKAEAQTLRAAMQERLQEILTDEQLKELESMKATREEKWGERGIRRGSSEGGFRGRSEVREATHTAMIEALELSTEQQEQLEQLHANRLEGAQELREKMKNGDREAVRESLDAMRDSFEEARAAILSEDQQEVVAIQQALVTELRTTRIAEGEVKGNRKMRGNR